MNQIPATQARRKKPAPFQDPALRSARKASIIGNYNNRLQSQIKDHLSETYNVSLPPFEHNYREQLPAIFDFEAYGEGLYGHLNELCRFYYALGKNRLFLASFQDASRMDHQLVPLGQYYSKHRLDPIWNSSKARKFRYIMASFLEREKWYEKYLPTHLVLTVPHKDGKWKGKTIYIRELIKAFTAMRKERWWKQVIAGGLYNLEVKKNRDNGYHIHLHVLCFQHPELYENGRKVIGPVNHVRDMIKSSWRSIVDNQTGYDGIHYSSLYYLETDESGQRIPEQNCYWMASDHEPEDAEIDMRQWRKHFVRLGEPVENWVRGVMECLKYHFKPGCLEKEHGKYDIELIRELLAHTKGDRFMSKFGVLHNHPGLSLNRRVKEEPTEIDDDVLGSAEAAEGGLINPFTGEKALSEEYIIYVTRPENALVNYDARGRPQVRIRNRSPVVIFQPGTSVLQAFRQWASKDFVNEFLPVNTGDFLRISSWLKSHALPPVSETVAPREDATLKRPEDDPNYCPF